jgi:hypothetical protein
MFEPWSFDRLHINIGIEGADDYSQVTKINT